MTTTEKAVLAWLREAKPQAPKKPNRLSFAFRLVRERRKQK